MNRDLDIDYSERAGFLVGKSAALAEWSFKKDAREFRRLCRALAKRKLRVARRAAGLCVACATPTADSLCPAHLAIARAANIACMRRRGVQAQRYLLLTLDGTTRHLSEWARITGIGATTIFMRLRAGWSEARALTAPTDRREPKAYCKRGHPRTEENLSAPNPINGGRYCKTCHRERGREA